MKRIKPLFRKFYFLAALLICTSPAFAQEGGPDPIPDDPNDPSTPIDGYTYIALMGGAIAGYVLLKKNPAQA